MRVKLSKVIKDLNVGMQTIQDFFAKKKIELDVTPNTKIDEDILEILIKEFKPDMEQKLKSEYLTSSRLKEKAKQTEEPKEPEEAKTETEVRKPKVIGKIDLDSAGKPAKKSAPKKEEPEAIEAPEPEQPKEEPVKVEEAVEATQPEPQPEPETKPAEVESKPEPQPEPVKEETETPEEPVETATAEPESEEKSDIFTTTPVLKTNINVVGKIDLSAINQSTRPKKKTKEERRQERIAKEKVPQYVRFVDGFPMNAASPP